MGDGVKFSNGEGDCCASMISSEFADNKNSVVICAKKICIFLEHVMIIIKLLTI
jgi:hypothetical protein